jgi:hypothetical protein
LSNAAKSIFAFGIYLIGFGAILVLAPNTAFALFGIPSTNEVWVRVVGMLLLFFAFYCIQAARKELTDFFQWTVYTRSMVIIFLTTFVLLEFVKPVLILVGVIDLFAAIWTGLALRSSKTVLP